MNAMFVRFVSRLLIASLFCLPIQAQADLIGTGQAMSAGQPQPARATLADRIEALGVPLVNARERVAALSDAEVAQLSGELDRLPAGAAGLGVGLILVAIFLIWRFTLSDQAKAEKK